jgi:hypothetical protein
MINFHKHMTDAQELYTGLCTYLSLAITVDDIQFPRLLAAEILENSYKMIATLQ